MDVLQDHHLGLHDESHRRVLVGTEKEGHIRTAEAVDSEADQEAEEEEGSCTVEVQPSGDY
jgi:hypothetical protein